MKKFPAMELGPRLDRPRIVWPAVPAAGGVLVGAALTPHLAFLPLGALALLVVLGFASGRAAGRVLAWLSIGLINAAVGWVLPERAPPQVDLERTITAVIEPVGHWRQRGDGFQCRCRLVRARQGAAVDLTVREVWVFLSGDEPPPRSRRLRVLARLRQTEPLANGGPPQRMPLRMTVSSRRLIEIDESEALGPVPALAARTRQRLAERFPGNAEGGRDGRALAGALLLGDAGRLDPSLARSLRAWGLAHLTAVSGLHLGLMVGLAIAATSWFGAGTWRFPSAVAVALGYLLLVGQRPSLARAVWMLMAVLGARAACRPGVAVNSLALVAAGLALANPTLIQDLGFRLTISATAGLLILGAALETRAVAPLLAAGRRAFCRREEGGEIRPSGPARWLSRAVAASLGAQIATLAFTLPSFSLLTPLAFGANLFFVPWTAMTLAISLLAASIALIEVEGLELIDLWLIDPLLALAELPFGWLTLSTPPLTRPFEAGSGPAIVLVAVVCGLVWLRGRRRVILALLLGASLVVFLSVRAAGRSVDGTPGPIDRRARPTDESDGDRIVFLDVGQGDATLLLSRGRAVLVDGGGFHRGDIASRVLIPALAREGVKAIDLAVMTHADRDHCGGLRDLASYVPMRELWLSESWNERECGRELVDRLRSRSVEVGVGHHRVLGSWRLDVLWSGKDSPTDGRDRASRPGSRRGPATTQPRNRSRSSRSSNNSSIVLLVSHRPRSESESGLHGPERRLLLTADIDRSVERALTELEPGLAGKIDWLRVAHHGSKSSTSAEFLDWATPSLAVVSVGRANPYGHPATPVLERLRQRQIPVLRTDLDGAVRIRLARSVARISTSRVRIAGEPGWTTGQGEVGGADVDEPR